MVELNYYNEARGLWRQKYQGGTIGAKSLLPIEFVRPNPAGMRLAVEAGRF